MFCERSNKFWVVPKKYSSKALALMEAIKMGAIALREKCLRIASWAKMTPARGALKPAEIAAATPQPIKMSGVIFRLKYFLINKPMVEPNWTRGPYWPTEPPPLITIKAARVELKPFLLSLVAFSL
jgi:hypothetical protein